jgi:hypothetical protein
VEFARKKLVISSGPQKGFRFASSPKVGHLRDLHSLHAAFIGATITI